MTAAPTPPSPPSPPPSSAGGTPYRSQLPPGRDGFDRLLLAEWTKLRTVGRWGLTLLAAMVITVLVSVLSATGSSVGGGVPDPVVGPDGKAVADTFNFVHKPLTGDGSVTARVSDLTGGDDDGEEPEPWDRAGVMIKERAEAGSPYAAVMITQGHGVRLRSSFVHDTAGSAASAAEPRWVRLTRAGDRLTGYESADGEDWRKVGTATLKGLPRTAQAGLFAAAPPERRIERAFGSTSVGEDQSQVTAVFDQVAVDGGQGAAWQRTEVGPDGDQGAGSGSGSGQDSGPDPDPGSDFDSDFESGKAEQSPDKVTEESGRFTITSTGDISPNPPDLDIAQQSLAGVQIGLIPLAALGVLFITAEYRRGMIRTTLTASPRRGRVLAAKALVLSGVAFAAGLVTTVLAFLLAEPRWRDGGHTAPRYPELALTDGPVLRALVGTAVLLAAVAVLALALGALLRHTAAAVAIIVVVFVLPMIVMSGLPLGTAHALMRLTPIAGFAIQRTTPEYGYYEAVCLPEDGCYPQGPWEGLAVLCAYALAALGLAVWRLRRRDA